jgi:O-antigen/teichoic acid export membrane protein
LASLKNLAGQTLWYGLSNIGAQMLNYLQNPILTYLLNDAAGMARFGEISTVYALIPFANVLFTYGMETAFFRFSNTAKDKDKPMLYQTAFGSLLYSTVLLSLVCWLCRVPIVHFLKLGQHPEYVTWAILIIALDALTAIPFARLRQEAKPRKYAFVKVTGIAINLVAVIFLIGLSPKIIEANPHGLYAAWHRQYSPTGFVLLANILQNLFVLVMLVQEWKVFRFRFDAALWRTIMVYAAPFVIIGLGGMVNEVVDRNMLLHLYHPENPELAKRTVAVYSSNYKLAIVITLFIRAFRMAAEPFFFAQSADKSAPATYAKVMKWFVITLCLAFLSTVLFLDIWKLMEGSSYWRGLGVVPILLFANIALGIYYNLAVWYKITAQLKYGVGITLVGAAITLVLNYLLIPVFGMYASAWATLVCYTTMMVLCYHYGQKHFPVPYNVKKLLSFIGVITILFGVHQGISWLTPNPAIRIGSGLVLMWMFMALLLKVERKELRTFPVIGKYL